MTQKDVVQTKLNFFNIVIANVILGAMIGLSIYNIQTSGSNFINVMAAIIALTVVGVYSGNKYKKLLAELKDLP